MSTGAAGSDPWQSLADCRRLIVIGTSGAGKTTLARELASLLGSPFVELDALHWDPNWTPAPPETFRARVAAATAGERWVVDGGYSAVRDLLWPRADTLIWLDYPIRVNLWRLLRRTCRRIATRAELWNSNRESFRLDFLSRDSLFVWVLKTHRRRRREYARLLARPEYAALTVVRLRSPRATERWLETVVGQWASGPVGQ